MFSRDFVYWLQGWLEIEDPKSIPEDKLDIIKNHLNLVFHFELEPPKKPKKENNRLRVTRRVDDRGVRMKC